VDSGRRLEKIFMAVITKIFVLWDVPPCILIDRTDDFGGTSCIDLQDILK
jgi:hypothetical protein